MSKVYVPASGDRNAKLMILGESPSYAEVQAGKPFVGPSGKELDKLLRDAGINRSDLWISNVCKYEVMPAARGSKIPFHIRASQAGIDLAEQVLELQNEINQIKPNCILALGSTALWALSGKNKISQFRGSILHGMGRKFVSTYHPAHLLYQQGGEIKGYWNKQIMVLDFKRALLQSQFPELRLPNRNLEICKSSIQLHEFYNRYKHLGKPSVDIESGGHCLPICIGLAFKPSHGISVPLWNVEGISQITNSDLVQIWILLAQILSENEIVGQNFNYDKDKLIRLGFKIKGVISDTMIKAFAINPELPKGLAFNTSIYTEEPFYKDEGMYEGSIQDLLIGNARDACVTKEIDINMDADLDEIGQRPYYENYLMKLPPMYHDIENVGFKIDPIARERLLRKYVSWDEKLGFELFQLVGDEVNVNSPKQIAILLWDNLGLPQKLTTGEEDLTELLNSPVAIKRDEHRQIIEKILERRRVKRTISHFLMAQADFDGRMRTTYFICLETGRSSTGMQEPPIRPTLEIRDENNKKKDKALGLPFQTMTKHGDIGADVREMFIAG